MVRKMLFTLFLAIVFSAIAVSASQLSTAPRAAACGNPCTSSAQCARPCACLLRPQGGGVCRL